MKKIEAVVQPFKLEEVKEALKNIEEAIALCLEVRAERGLPLTIETREVEVVA